jgi:hypothetical protein
VSAPDIRELHTPTLDGAVLLQAVEDYLTRFVAFPSAEAATAVALWVVHTHLLDCFESSPRLALLSPEPGSGKTRVQEILELLVPRPLFTLNASSAALFRAIADPEGRPTLLIDECDTIFGPRSSSEHEDLRGLVNAGHRRGATSLRCVVRGKTIDVESFPAYCAVSLSGLDDLPDTIMTRSVVIRMRRRAPDEHVEPFRHRVHAAAGHALREQLAAWSATIAGKLAGTWPVMPAGVEDRAADCWEPLIAIADAAGGHWPETARVTAVTLVTDARRGGETLGIRLLADLQRVFTDAAAERMTTEHLLEALNGLDDAPWGDLRGKPLDARSLSRRLSKYDVSPRTIRVDGTVKKGYELTDLVDVFRRYLPGLSLSPQGAVTSVTAVTGPTEAVTEPSLSLSPMASVTSVTTVTVPAENLGPCTRCGQPCHRYGDGGRPLCATCRGVAP